MDVQNTEELYGKQSGVTRYETLKKLLNLKMTAGTPVRQHVVKMIFCIEDLAGLGYVLDPKLCIDIVLQSLPSTFSTFVSIFNMNSIMKKLEPTLLELLNMLRREEIFFKEGDAPNLLDGKSSSSSKLKVKGKIKKKIPQGKAGVKKVKDKGKEGKNEKGRVECFFCHKKGHYKKECRGFLATLQKEKQLDASSSGVKKQ